MNRRTMRILVLVLFLLGFVAALVVGARQAGEGYSIQFVNQMPEDITVYRRASDEQGIGRTETVGILERGQASVQYYLPAGEVCELLFAPRWTVQRVARVELPKDALRITNCTEGPLLITLNPNGPELSYDSLARRVLPRLGWTLPVLYLAAVGWIVTLVRWGRRISHRL